MTLLRWFRLFISLALILVDLCQFWSRVWSCIAACWLATVKIRSVIYNLIRIRPVIGYKYVGGWSCGYGFPFRLGLDFCAGPGSILPRGNPVSGGLNFRGVGCDLIIHNSKPSTLIYGLKDSVFRHPCAPLLATRKCYPLIATKVAHWKQGRKCQYARFT
jgi:hypothetical protein